MISAQYAAGFFDGEGCINVSSCRSSTLIRTLVVNTNLTVLELFQERWGGDINPNKKGKDHWKQAYTWRLSYKSALLFLQDIYPFLIVKAPQAEAAFIFFENSPGRGGKHTEESLKLTLEAIDKIKAHNKKGIPV